MTEFLTVFALAALSGNILLTKTVGADWLETVWRDRRMSMAFCLTLIVTSVAASAGAYLVGGFTEGHSYAVLVYAVIIAVILCLLRFGLSSMKGMEDVLKIIPVLAADSAVLMIAMNCVSECETLTDALLYSLGASVGLCFALATLAAAAQKMKFSAPPKAFGGLPLLIVTLAILAMAFSAFGGISFE